MHATQRCYQAEDFGYEITSRRRTAPVSSRVGQIAARELTGRERASHAARYGRRVAPKRLSASFKYY